MPPICPPSRSAIWTHPRNDDLRQAVLSEPHRPSLGELVWLDCNRDGLRGSAKCRHTLTADRPALPAPAEPVVLPTPKTQKGVPHV